MALTSKTIRPKVFNWEGCLASIGGGIVAGLAASASEGKFSLRDLAARGAAGGLVALSGFLIPKHKDAAPKDSAVRETQ